MNKPLILVVEDDAAVRNLIATTLETHNYRYQAAPTGEAAILEAVSHNPDVILLDLGLPDMDGMAIIQKIRTWSKTPIIVISARSEDTDKIDALDAGADDYLTKPFSVEELLARLRVTFRRLNDAAGGDSVQESVFPGLVVTDKDGQRISYTSIRGNNVLSLSVGRFTASLHASLSTLRQLRAEGIETITFQTILCSTTLSVDELLAMGGEDAEAVLTHRFTDSSLTVG